MVNIVRVAPPNAGTDNTLTICYGGTLTRAQAESALGVHDTGSWNVSFPLNNLTGGLNLIHTVPATSPCTGNDTAVITVNIQPLPNAGTDTSVTVCAGDEITQAQAEAYIGTHDPGGTWSESFPLIINSASTLTYTVDATSPCTGSDSASVSFSIQEPPDAGTITATANPVCITDSTQSLTSNGAAGGSWSVADSSVLTIDENGRIIPVSPGTTTVYYTVAPVFPCTENGVSEINITVTAQIIPTFSFPHVFCHNSTPYPLPVSSNNGYTGSWFLNLITGPVPVTQVDTSVPNNYQYIFVPDAGQGCAGNYITDITIQDGGFLELHNGLNEWVPEGYIIVGDDTHTIVPDIPGGSFSSSNTAVLTINPTTGLINTNILGASTITYFSPNGCKTTFEIVVIEANFPGGIMSPKIWMKSDELTFSTTLVTRATGRVSRWRNSLTNRWVQQADANRRPLYVESDPYSFNYHRFIKFDSNREDVLYIETNNPSVYMDRLSPLNSSIYLTSTGYAGSEKNILSYRFNTDYSYSYEPSQKVFLESDFNPGMYTWSVDISDATVGQNFYSENAARIIGSEGNLSGTLGIRNEFNSNAVIQGNNPPPNFDPNFTIGARDVRNNYSDDAIAEIIAYDRNLNDVESQRLKSYLAIKYGISFKHMPGSGDDDYFNSRGNLIYDPDEHPGFNHNITIVGRDNTGINSSARDANKDLYQKQSQSVNNNGLLTLYLNNSIQNNAKFNSENPVSTGFPNRNFFVIADNDASLNLSCHEDTFQKIERVWEMKRIGTFNRVSVGFSPGELPASVSHILVSADPAFPPANTSYDLLSPYTGTGGTVKGYIFDNTNADKLNVPHGQYFTFGSVIIPEFDLPEDYCISQVVNLPGTSLNGIAGTWSPSSVVNTTRAGVFTYIFTPDPGNCAAPFEYNFEIIQLDQDFSNLDLTHCIETDFVLPLADEHGITGHWEHNGITVTTLETGVVNVLNLMFVPDTGQGCYIPETYPFTIEDCPCPPEQQPTITLQPVGNLCSAGLTQISLNAVINANVSEVSWTSSGGGTFGSNTTTGGTNVYYPVTGDFASGSISFTVTTNDPAGQRCDADSDTKTVTFTAPVEGQFAQTVFEICQGESFSLPATTNGVNGTWNPSVYQTNITNYTFTPNGNCVIPTSITINTTAMPPVDILPDVSVCKFYDLPVLQNGNYYTQSGGNGTMLNAGDDIMATQTIYIYNETGGNPNCFNESSFTVTIYDQTEVDELEDVSACNSFTLPVLNHGNYYSQPNGNGTVLAAGSVITSSQIVYIYAESGTVPNCTSESSFEVNITDDIIPVFDFGNQLNYCQGETVVQDLYNVSDNMLGISGSWNTAVISTAASGTTDYVFSPDAGQCAEEFTLEVTVKPIPVTTAIIPSN